jgi:hypothetical protein
MDNTKVCIICNDAKSLTMFSYCGSDGYGRTCSDCYKVNFQNGLIICNTCDAIKPMNKFRNFGESYGRLCHDC